MSSTTIRYTLQELVSGAIVETLDRYSNAPQRITIAQTGLYQIITLGADVISLWLLQPYEIAKPVIVSQAKEKWLVAYIKNDGSHCTLWYNTRQQAQIVYDLCVADLTNHQVALAKVELLTTR